MNKEIKLTCGEIGHMSLLVYLYCIEVYEGRSQFSETTQEHTKVLMRHLHGSSLDDFFTRTNEQQSNYKKVMSSHLMADHRLSQQEKDQYPQLHDHVATNGTNAQLLRCCIAYAWSHEDLFSRGLSSGKLEYICDLVSIPLVLWGYTNEQVDCFWKDTLTESFKLRLQISDYTQLQEEALHERMLQKALCA